MNTELLEIQPVGDRILIEPIKTENTYNNIIIPDIHKTKERIGKVILHGTGRTDKGDGEYKFTIPIGAKIIMPEIEATLLTYKGKKYHIAREEDIVAIIDD